MRNILTLAVLLSCNLANYGAIYFFNLLNDAGGDTGQEYSFHHAEPLLSSDVLRYLSTSFSQDLLNTYFLFDVNKQSLGKMSSPIVQVMDPEKRPCGYFGHKIAG